MFFLQKVVECFKGIADVCASWMEEDEYVKRKMDRLERSLQNDQLDWEAC